ncbi:MAG: hypothetical protein KJZ83_00380 [Burkholderiaceae bacterium]|nr:hypothetical protein [Burkholderiaceae bacterium]
MFREATGGGAVTEAFASDPFAASVVSNDPHSVSIKKTDDEQQLVFGEVYAPGFPDSQGDFMTRESIQEMAYAFMRKGLVDKIDLNHSQEVSGCYVVESFIARDDDSIFIPGSWVLGVKVPDLVTWELVKTGELNGFSFDGIGVRVEKVIEIDLPQAIDGETDEVGGHKHTFYVKYDEDGRFLGGLTGPGPDGHVHKILRGTVTEVTDDHAHRFSFVEGVLSAQIAN